MIGARAVGQAYLGQTYLGPALLPRILTDSLSFFDSLRAFHPTSHVSDLLFFSDSIYAYVWPVLIDPLVVVVTEARTTVLVTP